jgi:hypothetical protein
MMSMALVVRARKLDSTSTLISVFITLDTALTTGGALGGSDTFLISSVAVGTFKPSPLVDCRPFTLSPKRDFNAVALI